MIARIAAAASIWPRWPRSAWISGRSGAVEPMIASVDRQETSSAFCAARQAAKRPASAQAVENCVPLISASPSLAARVSGASPAAASASAPGRTPAVVLGLARAEHHRGHVGERREVARGADRALHRHDRGHAAREHRLRAARRAASARPRRRGRARASFSAIISRDDGARGRRRRRPSSATGSGCAAAGRCRRRRS